MPPKRACDLCYSKKISCDRSDRDAACDWCRHHQLTCTFDRARARKRCPKPRIENSVFAVERSLSSQLQPVDFVLDRVMMDQVNSSTSSSPFVQESQPGHCGIFAQENFKPDDLLESSMPLAESHLSQLNDLGCLDRETAWQILQAYSESSVRYVLPLVDPVLFQDSLELAYSSEETIQASQRAQAQGSILALISVLSFLDDHALSLSHDLGMKCASQASALVEFTNEEASLLNLQTVSLLRLQCAFTGQISGAIKRHETACRLVKELGCHTMGVGGSGLENTAYNQRENRELRTLFWHSYITDKQIIMRTGMEPLLPDDICDLTLPKDCSASKGYPIPELKDGGMSLPPYGVLSPCLVGDIQLSILKSKVWRLLYSTEARQRSEAELLWAVRELDGELEAWRMSVPTKLRPTFLIADKRHISPPEIDLPSWVRHHATTLHLEYRHLFITIHQANARYQFSKGSDSLEHAWSSSVQSSITLALEASRSTLLYLETVLDRLAKEMFWMCIHYPIVALRTLFVNIVANPSGPDAKSDLQLLCSTASLIERMPMSNRLVHGKVYIQKIEEEISGLVEYVRSLKG
ncbi:Fungal-trans domain-containing protein [Fusarium keratoplasticum]|uniref:Fungal-trans domain-containing protein n=1 Tax=Fusarium keratoplasticum TaxID=1328300 RepID=A0ACC0QKX8_9HYPO|nr:Fungal-trans domain-containing protein [Fusarium keratoplasticum]KAI8657226.1 Fungal-trans domain-containing protein [Fusarium keratoplasticum]